MRLTKILLAVTVYTIMAATGHGFISAMVVTLLILLTYVILKRVLSVMWFIVTLGQSRRRVQYPEA